MIDVFKNVFSSKCGYKIKVQVCETLNTDQMILEMSGR